MSVRAALFSVPEGDRSWWAVILWWEKRRLVFNAVVGAVGLVNLLVFAYLNEVLLRPHASFEERDWEPLSVVAGALMANVLYSGGWVSELLLRGFTRSSNARRFGPAAFGLGLGLAVAVTFVPIIHDGLRWLHFVSSPHRG